MQETAEARLEEANRQQPLSVQPERVKDDEGAFDEPMSEYEETSPRRDENDWSAMSASKQMPNDPWQSDEQTEAPEERFRRKRDFSSTALYRFLVNRKLEDADDMNEPK